VPLNEYVLSKAGQLIEAPVCSVSLVRIPPEWAGEEIRDGYALVPGIASGSADVDGVVDKKELLYRGEDDNAARHAGVYALYDWCWGSDDQWLYCADSDNAVHSHDHGHYLPSGPNWTVASLDASVDQDHTHPASPEGVSSAALDGFADSLEAVTRAQLGSSLNTVPPSWPVTYEEL
jgi:hypothetical protein